jgi:hypothetical protein
MDGKVTPIRLLFILPFMILRFLEVSGNAVEVTVEVPDMRKALRRNSRRRDGMGRTDLQTIGGDEERSLRLRER